jgi:hypothetical protein
MQESMQDTNPQTTDKVVTEDYVLRKSLSFIASLEVSEDANANVDNLQKAIWTARNVIDESF